jgi:hypothetical protein
MMANKKKPFTADGIISFIFGPPVLGMSALMLEALISILLGRESWTLKMAEKAFFAPPSQIAAPLSPAEQANLKTFQRNYAKLPHLGQVLNGEITAEHHRHYQQSWLELVTLADGYGTKIAEAILSNPKCDFYRDNYDFLSTAAKKTYITDISTSIRQALGLKTSVQFLEGSKIRLGSGGHYLSSNDTIHARIPDTFMKATKVISHEFAHAISAQILQKAFAPVRQPILDEIHQGLKNSIMPERLWQASSPSERASHIADLIQQQNLFLKNPIIIKSKGDSLEEAIVDLVGGNKSIIGNDRQKAYDSLFGLISDRKVLWAAPALESLRRSGDAFYGMVNNRMWYHGTSPEEIFANRIEDRVAIILRQQTPATTIKLDAPLTQTLAGGNQR